jgi:hypothetical protein
VRDDLAVRGQERRFAQEPGRRPRVKKNVTPSFSKCRTTSGTRLPARVTPVPETTRRSNVKPTNAGVKTTVPRGAQPARIPSSR